MRRDEIFLRLDIRTLSSVSDQFQNLLLLVDPSLRTIDIDHELQSVALGSAVLASERLCRTVTF